MLSPCKDCKRRKIGCHNVETCEPWRVYVEANQARLAARRQVYEEYEDVKSHLLRHKYTLKDK